MSLIRIRLYAAIKHVFTMQLIVFKAICQHSAMTNYLNTFHGLSLISVGYFHFTPISVSFFLCLEYSYHSFKKKKKIMSKEILMKVMYLSKLLDSKPFDIQLFTELLFNLFKFINSVPQRFLHRMQ